MVKEETDLKSLQKMIGKAVHSITRTWPMTNEDRQDAVQDVFVALFSEGSKSLKAFDPDRKMALSTFVFMVTRSLLIDSARASRGRHWQKEDKAEDMDLVSFVEPQAHQLDPLSIFMEGEHHRQLEEAIGKLSEDDQEFLKTVFSDDFDIEACAVRFKCCVGTVYTRKHRLAKRLSSLLSFSSLAA